jgi:2-methylcitrate dehydratase
LPIGWAKRAGKFITVTYIAYLLSCAFADYFNPEANGYDHDAQALFYLPLVMGSMMGLSIPQMTQAQRIAGMFGLSMNQAALGNVTDWKHCTFASCALRALHAVKLALAGFEGPGEIYEGEAGINHFFPHAECILHPLPDLQSIILKQRPALVFCQTPIDVACDLAAKIENPANIERVVVHTHRKAIEEAAQESPGLPVSRAGRTHSLAYCVAVALVKKDVAFDHFDDAFINKEKIVADVISRIAIVEDAAMTEAFPEKAPCRIMVTLQSGVMIEGFREFPHGDPPIHSRTGKLKTRHADTWPSLPDKKKQPTSSAESGHWRRNRLLHGLSIL